MIYGIIYKIANLVNSKIYIGQTTRTIKERWDDHKYDAGSDNNIYLYNAMRKYSINNFKIEDLINNLILIQKKLENERNLYSNCKE